MKWDVLPIALNQGLAEHEALNSFAKSTGLSLGDNLDFSKKGALRGRPGLQTKTTFSTRGLDAGGTSNFSNLSNLAATGYSEPLPFAVKDSRGERPGLLTRGRIYVHDGSRWQDRGPATQVSVSRLQDFRTNITQWPEALTAGDWDASSGAAYSLGFTDSIEGTLSAGMLDSDGRVFAQDKINTASLTSGDFACGALCGSVSALLVKQPATNDLCLVLHTAGNATTTVISPLVSDAHALGASVDSLAKPVICCDNSQTIFFVVYWTTTANTIKVLRVNTAGTILTSATFAVAAGAAPGGGGTGGLWISNSNVATDRLVIAWALGSGNGVNTKVLNATTLVDQAIDVTINPTGGGPSLFNLSGPGQVVVGVVSTTEAVVAFTARTTDYATDDSAHFTIARRSLSAATSRIYFTQKFYASVDTVGNTNVAQNQIFLQHQPVVVGGRIFLGLFFLRGIHMSSGGVLTPRVYALAGTWVVVDITDLWCNGTATGATSGNLIEPAVVAQGPLDGSAPPWVPKPAMVSGSTYRFPTVDWRDVFPSPFVATTSPGLGAGIAVESSVCFLGDKGSLALNELSFLSPQVAHVNEATILAGNVPTMLSGAWAHPVGFHWNGAPAIRVGTGAGAGVTGTIGLHALWSWMDGNGRVHRSAPSNRAVVTLTNVQTFQVTVTPPVFSGRPPGSVWVEVYSTDTVNTTGRAPHYLVARSLWDGAIFGDTSVDFTIPTNILAEISSEILYTTGGVLPNQPVRADGGVCAVGDRCWVSDGTKLFASKLGDEVAGTDATAWHVDGPLTVRLPGNFGRVVSLQKQGEYLVVLTESAVWYLTGVGPDDLGSGPNFSQPLLVSDLGCATQRAACSTPQGVVYVAKYNEGDGTPDSGGLWLIKGEDALQISAPVRDTASGNLLTSPADLEYAPSRGLLLWSSTSGNTTLVYDMRVGQWTKWTVPGAERWAEARGILWATGMEDPAALVAARGQDVLAETTNIEVVAKLGNVPIGGGPGGLGKLRSVKVISEPGHASYELSVVTTFDDVTTLNVDFAAHTGVEAEAFYSRQKAARVSIELTADKGVDTWTGLELLVKPIARNKQGRRQAD